MDLEKGISLDGKWRLGMVADRDYTALPPGITTLGALDASLKTMAGNVPGNFELDLQENGVIQEQFFGDNYLSLAQYEDRHVFYGRRFEFDGDPQNMYLVFDGIDTIADIYLNGLLLAHVENMFVPHEVRADGLRRTSIVSDAGEGEFCFLINHEKVFVKGTNWVPVDAFHSRDSKRIPRILDMVGDIGCNAVRCWGGSVYEDEAFFDICDEKGIMVCGVYPTDEPFKEMLREEAGIVTRRLRNHPSLCLRVGGFQAQPQRQSAHTQGYSGGPGGERPLPPLPAELAVFWRDRF